jgi:hypothetical protein
MSMVPSDGSIVNALKLARVHGMAIALIDELHRGHLDDPSRVRLEHLTHDALVETGSAVPDDLLEELHRLVQPAERATASDDELRLLWAELLGWLKGVALGERIEDMRSFVEHDLEDLERYETELTAPPLDGPYL